MKIREVLQRKSVVGVVTIGAHETLRSLVETLREKRIGAMMATDGGGRLVGVISERDVVRALAEEGEVCLNQQVSRYMTKEVVSTDPEESTESVLGRMSEGRFRHMPVLENNRMVGVVSIGDLVKARIDSLQKENEALEEFIRG